MEINQLIEKYIDAWNRMDPAGLLKLMHAGAAYYDAFWMDCCVGPDLKRYFQDSMDEEPYWYEQVGDTIETVDGAVYRYSAHARSGSGSGTGDALHYGAEVLVIRDDLILTVSDFYCSSDQASLEEVALVAATRHGVPRHLNSGLSTLKASRVKSKLLTKIEEEQVYVDPDMSVVALADKLGCTPHQLMIVIEKQFGLSVAQLLDSHRVKLAKALLTGALDTPKVRKHIASEVGFRSVEEFTNKFTEFYGVTPSEFCQEHAQQGVSRLH